MTGARQHRGGIPVPDSTDGPAAASPSQDVALRVVKDKEAAQLQADLQHLRAELASARQEAADKTALIQAGSPRRPRALGSSIVVNPLLLGLLPQTLKSRVDALRALAAAEDRPVDPALLAEQRAGATGGGGVSSRPPAAPAQQQLVKSLEARNKDLQTQVNILKAKARGIDPRASSTAAAHAESASISWFRLETGSGPRVGPAGPSGGGRRAAPPPGRAEPQHA